MRMGQRKKSTNDKARKVRKKEIVGLSKSWGLGAQISTEDAGNPACLENSIVVGQAENDDGLERASSRVNRFRVRRKDGGLPACPRNSMRRAGQSANRLSRER